MEASYAEANSLRPTVGAVYTNTAPEDVYSRFQRNALLAEQWRRMRQYQDLASKDAIFKLKIIGALVGFGILAAIFS